MKNYLEKSTAFVLDELITTSFREWFFGVDLDEYLEEYSANIDEQKIVQLRERLVSQVEKKEGLVEGLNTRFPESSFGSNVAEIIRIELMEFDAEGQAPLVKIIDKHFNLRIGNKVIELMRVSYMCWMAQENLMDRSKSDIEVRRSAETAQLKNSDRAELIMEIDGLLKEDYRTVATKTYHTYLDKE